MSIKLNLPRIITAKDQPLTMDQLKTVAPAAFSRMAGVNCLKQYRPIPTIDAIDALMLEGFVPSFAAQARSKHPMFDQEAKHVIRMRHENHFKPKLNEEVPELILVNSNDGSSKFFIYMGLFRFICTNGMIAGHTLETYELRHVGEDLSGQVKEMLTDVTRKALPMLEQQVTTMRKRQLTTQEQAIFAARAIELRWPEGTDSVTTQALLNARRRDDAANDLWHTFNRVQENLIQGGFHAHNTARLVRPLEQVTSLVNVNRALWDLALKVAA